MNQQDKDGQTLRPFPDFKVNDRVTYNGRIGIVNRVSDISGVKFSVHVVFPDGDEDFFTTEGRWETDGDVVLFRLEESDKPEQTSNNEQDSTQDDTFFKTLKWLTSVLEHHNGEGFTINGEFYLNEDLQSLYTLYKGQEEGR